METQRLFCFARCRDGCENDSNRTRWGRANIPYTHGRTGEAWRGPGLPISSLAPHVSDPEPPDSTTSPLPPPLPRGAHHHRRLDASASPLGSLLPSFPHPRSPWSTRPPKRSDDREGRRNRQAKQATQKAEHPARTTTSMAAP
ncbi:hypothetical protein HU200_007088 [Digitaria exilis]|uniref:Uncharacterized protein n=1 Tax=Digitaria exilis TaxID=1010633 RepID=A0A835KRH3_9POAL|nr:hypothetical protein HU200_007088 [Digitaria exilis]